MENTTATEGFTQDNGTAPAEEAKQERTFTQSEVNAMISKRVAKYSDYDTLKEKAAQFDANEEASKSELQKAQDKARTIQEKYDALMKANSVRELHIKVSQETGVPIDLLTADSEEACKAQAEAIMQFAKSQGGNTYPSLQDNGEAQKVGTSTRAQFDNWAAQFI